MHTFTHVRLPKMPDSDSVRFSAYAFNSDRVKSVISPALEYRISVAAAKQNTCCRAYVISVGVNANQSRWNLDLAVPSAKRIQQLFATKLRGHYSEVIRTELYSDLAENGLQAV